MTVVIRGRLAPDIEDAVRIIDTDRRPPDRLDYRDAGAMFTIKLCYFEGDPDRIMRGSMRWFPGRPVFPPIPRKVRWP